VLERYRKQTANVLHQEEARSHVRDEAQELPKQGSPWVLRGLAPPCCAEGLARRPAHEQVKLSRPEPAIFEYLCRIEVRDVRFDDAQLWRESACLSIGSNRFAKRMLLFDASQQLEAAGSVEAEIKPHRAGEQ